MFSTKGDFINKVPPYITGNTELIVKSLFVGVGVLLLVILGVILLVRGNKRKKEDSKFDKKIPIALYLVVVCLFVGMEIFVLIQYTDYLLYQRVEYTDNNLEEIKKLEKVSIVPDSIDQIKNEGKEVNSSVLLIKDGTNKGIKNGYYGSYMDEDMQGLYKVKYTTSDGESEAVVKVLPVYNGSEKVGEIEGYKTKDGQLVNSVLYLTEEDYTQFLKSK